MVLDELTIDLGNIILYKPVDPSFLLNIIEELFLFSFTFPQKRRKLLRIQDPCLKLNHITTNR